MIKQCSLSSLQFAINQVLALDSTVSEKFSRLNNKVIKMTIKPLGINFFIKIVSGSVILLDQYDGEINTTIQSSPIGLIRLSLLPTSKVRSLFNDQIQISGDIELGQQIKTIFDSLDIDWEGHLANFTGDVAAHQVGNFLRQGLAFKQQLTSSVQYNVSDYIHEELRAFPPTEEINDFFSDVDDLALHVERIEAHINQYKASHESD